MPIHQMKILDKTKLILGDTNNSFILHRTLFSFWWKVLYLSNSFSNPYFLQFNIEYQMPGQIISIIFSLFKMSVQSQWCKHAEFIITNRFVHCSRQIPQVTTYFYTPAGPAELCECRRVSARWCEPQGVFPCSLDTFWPAFTFVCPTPFQMSFMPHYHYQMHVFLI